MAKDNRTSWHQFFDALSLSGAIIFMFFSLTLLGIFLKDEKVWTTFATAFTTFVSGKRLAESEQQRIIPPVEPKPEPKPESLRALDTPNGDVIDPVEPEEVPEPVVAPKKKRL